MTKILTRRALLAQAGQGTTAAALLAVPGLSLAQSNPNWPVDTLKIMVPAPAGGGVDIYCRKTGERLAAHLGIAVVIDNKAGAGGLLGAKALSASAPDGSSIGFIHSGLVSVQAMGGKLDLLAEFRPIVGRYNESQFIVAVHADSKYRTFGDLMKDIAANPGKLNYGTGGLGSPAHIAFENLRAKVGNLQAQDVPFKGAIDGVNALLAKDLDFMLGVLSTVQVQVKTGRLRALAVTGATRSQQLPDVPTIAESGVPGFSHVSWSGFFAPSRMPDRLVANLQGVLAKMAKETDYLQFIAANGGQIPPVETAAEFQAFLRESITRETAVMAKLGLKAG